MWVLKRLAHVYWKPSNNSRDEAAFVIPHTIFLSHIAARPSEIDDSENARKLEKRELPPDIVLEEIAAISTTNKRQKQQ